MGASSIPAKILIILFVILIIMIVGIVIFAVLSNKRFRALLNDEDDIAQDKK